jgi:hypothetical protein
MREYGQSGFSRSRGILAGLDDYLSNLPHERVFTCGIGASGMRRGEGTAG